MMYKNNRVIKCVGAAIDGKLGEVRYNAGLVLDVICNAEQSGVNLLAFPEMVLTGYSCGDILYNQYIYEEIDEALLMLMNATKDFGIITVVGTPLKLENRIFNCAVVLHKGNIVGVVPKVQLIDSNEKSESRWFDTLSDEECIEGILCKTKIKVSSVVLFSDIKNKYKMGVVVGDDFECPISYGNRLAIAGADVIINISAGYEVIHSFETVSASVKVAAVQNKCAYIYVSSGNGESTTDGVFRSYKGIYECRQCLAETDEYNDRTKMVEACVDIDRIQQERILSKSFWETRKLLPWKKIEEVPISLLELPNQYSGVISNEPFLEGLSIEKVCRRVIRIQELAIIEKMRYMNRDKLIIGVSGGLDSTVALLACCSALRSMDIPLTNIIGVTMPGPGTTKRTYRNSIDLMKTVGVDLREIDITQAVKVHLKNIKHPDGLYDITYEQTQSRERTKILMDLANQENGIVIGTGDMSEIALGWMSYSGDQISMYGINSGIPKTVIKHLANYYVKNLSGKERDILQDIVNTPVSPELLPVDENGEQRQKTENLVGPYIVHDFYLYYFVKYGYTPEKILKLSSIAFQGQYNEEQLRAWMITFITRFYTRQFKRTCFPDGCKVFDVYLSPRTGWKMPSDVYCKSLIERVEG